MILSAFDLNRRDASVRQCLRNPYDMHRSVMSGFPDTPGMAVRSALNILYRLQETDQGIRIYVLSDARPDWSRLSAGFAAVGEPKNLSEMIAAFKPGNRYRFDLLANPCKKTAVSGGNSKRVFLAEAEKREDWLRRKAEQMGFRLCWMREDGQTDTAARSPDGHEIRQTGVRFRGELIVEDAALFAHAFSKGIGPGKAFGFGMLMLFPCQGGD